MTPPAEVSQDTPLCSPTAQNEAQIGVQSGRRSPAAAPCASSVSAVGHAAARDHRYVAQAHLSLQQRGVPPWDGRLWGRAVFWTPGGHGVLRDGRGFGGRGGERGARQASADFRVDRLNLGSLAGTGHPARAPHLARLRPTRVRWGHPGPEE